MDEVRILEIKQSVFKNNDEQADKLRRELKEKGVFLLNLMSSPGAGKTTTLKATIAALKDKVKIGVMEAKENSRDGSQGDSAAHRRNVPPRRGNDTAGARRTRDRRC